MNHIRVFFVVPEGCTDHSEASDIMVQAYESCRQNRVNVSWIEATDVNTIEFSKTDCVIFQDFKGEHFESLIESKCARILGPWCVLVCLTRGIPIPNFTWPIYNVAMLNCIVSCSSINKTKKLEIKEKVQLMGGCYSDSLLSKGTHLITEGVKSEKYLTAAENGLKIFTSKWLDAVWSASQTDNIHCDDEEFNKYRCPPFYNLTISSTGFPNLAMRSQVAETVAKHGGIFTANLAVSTTDVLVVNGQSGISSKKYQAARTNSNIFCVTVDWIHDSIAKGYALSHNSYKVTTKGSSTPVKEDITGLNFSILSAIGDVTSRCPPEVEETLITKKLQPTNLFLSKISPNKRKGSTTDDLGALIDGLDIKKAKKAGQYLDGCSIYLAGFKVDQREKLAKILNLSGATRYDDITDRLTHIIIGDSTCPEAKIIKAKNYSVSLVSIHWLLESMDKQKVVDEENYLINLHDFDKDQFSSPLGKKGLSLLRTSKTLTSNETQKSTPIRESLEMEADDELMQQYLKPQSRNEDSDTLAQFLKDHSSFNSKPNTSENTNSKLTADMASESSHSTQCTRTNEDSNIFYSKKFVIMNFSVEESQYIKEQIESVLGSVMPKTYKGIPDYVVAPPFITSSLQVSALEIVNPYWITESIQECEEVAFAYYHRPLVIHESKPLENCVVTISGYTTYERNFLKELIEALGGDSQEQFARVLCVEKNVKASTHLVSLEAKGKKYTAALKWGLPVVRKEWLFECAKTGRLVSEQDFLMGDSIAPTRSVPSESGNILKVSNSPNISKRCTPSSTKASKKIATPVNREQQLNVSRNEHTPVNHRLFAGVSETPCTQVTPIHKLMEEVRKTNLLGTPETPPLTKTWYDVDTPESPFGAFIRPHLSPKSKKEIMRYINRLPDFVPPKEEKKSTPLSEVKRRCWAKLLGTQESPSQFTKDKTASTSQEIQDEQHIDTEDQEERQMEDVNTQGTEQNTFINTKLKQIEEMMSAFSENRRSSRTFQDSVPAEVGKPSMKESQPFTVGWDYDEDIRPEPQPRNRIFIISGVENDQRQEFVTKLESLGGQVSELNSYDPQCTHLICPKPARNEKTLACMASGKWILHISYVDKCVAAGKFLPEEDFEFGNPKAKDNIKLGFDKENDSKVQSIYWWRKEISRRGYGAFNDMRAIVVAQRREPIVRVIEAGGGQVVEATPPFDENIYATHCLLEARSVSDFSVYNSLAQQGILCIHTLYVSDFLYRTNKDIKDAILPHFSNFYS